jgi:hypothetical protein
MWDMDRLRILKVLAELEAAFDIRMAATLDELRRYASDKAVCAVLIGLPLGASEGIAAFSRALKAEETALFLFGRCPDRSGQRCRGRRCGFGLS